MTQSIIGVGTIVSFITKKQELSGKVIKIYQQGDKTYYKISSNKRYYFKQLKNLTISL